MVLRTSFFAMMLFVSIAHADVYELVTKPRTVVVGDPAKRMVTSESFRIVAPTPYVSGKLNAAVAADARALGAFGKYGLHAAHAFGGTVSCQPALATSRLVSWACSWRADDGMVGGLEASAYAIDGDAISAVTLDTLFGANVAKLDAIAGADGCHVTIGGSDRSTLVVGGDGIEVVREYSFHGCALGWDALRPLLVNSPATRAITAVLAGASPPPADMAALWAVAPPRFVADKEGVFDRVSGLVWAPRDNGSDLTWAAADAYARAYRGGGHADWRLPSEEELEVFAQPETAHKDKADCTKGTSYLLATPLVQLSCGLAWSSTEAGKSHAVAFGFLSGSSRISPVGERKNFRALVVRTR